MNSSRGCGPGFQKPFLYLHAAITEDQIENSKVHGEGKQKMGQALAGELSPFLK